MRARITHIILWVFLMYNKAQKPINFVHLKGGVIMDVSIFATFNPPIDAMSLYDELKLYKLNVTDFIEKVAAYGDLEDYQLGEVIQILLKYGSHNITITNPSV